MMLVVRSKVVEVVEVVKVEVTSLVVRLSFEAVGVDVDASLVVRLRFEVVDVDVDDDATLLDEFERVCMHNLHLWPLSTHF